MEIMDFKEFKKRKGIIKEIKSKIFIYPTDTIYGIGCNSLNKDLVEKIRKIKKSKKPFSVIAPSKNWIYKNCHYKKAYIEKLPGKYTFILKLKRKIFPNNVSFGKTVGVRIPKHEFCDLIRKAKVPFITTSVNKSGEKNITKIDDISRRIRNKVDYIIDYGPLNGKPSTIIDLTKKIAKIIRP